uniref:Uncharacterized protein n=1 Tax=Grammatophora oceanica TaxID=210454 RepID=A0A7S1UPL5_9STRA|mmetsp:Transcript_15807/g.23303  ORF Transcript_15807/g.23303 Transcript_15807/m.23303 type:complete len:100 (+) Transcript_15807:1334-1633(+)
MVHRSLPQIGELVFKLMGQKETCNRYLKVEVENKYRHTHIGFFSSVSSSLSSEKYECRLYYLKQQRDETYLGLALTAGQSLPIRGSGNNLRVEKRERCL